MGKGSHDKHNVKEGLHKGRPIHKIPHHELHHIIKNDVHAAINEHHEKHKPKAHTPYAKILTVIIFFAVIIIFAYLFMRSETAVLSYCKVMHGLACDNVVMTPEEISFEVTNFHKEHLNLTIQLEGCSESVTQFINPNGLATYRFACPAVIDIVMKDMYITYTGYSGLEHQEQGKIAGKIR
jgi:hypothetical protein